MDTISTLHDENCGLVYYGRTSTGTVTFPAAFPSKPSVVVAGICLVDVSLTGFSISPPPNAPLAWIAQERAISLYYGRTSTGTVTFPAAFPSKPSVVVAGICLVDVSLTGFSISPPPNAPLAWIAQERAISPMTVFDKVCEALLIHRDANVYDQARAVFAAMREPSEAMQIAGHNVRNDPKTGMPTLCGTDEIYTAMIDAAATEPGP